MYLTEKHTINKKGYKDLFEKIDSLCYASKNLYNSVNYIITQASRISYKLKQGEILESWEKSFLYHLNCGIKGYNDTRPDKKPLSYIDGNNNFIANAYFLHWYLKGKKEYKALYAACSQKCIHTVCRNWKSFYNGLKAFKNSNFILSIPRKPGYYDKITGRNWLELTYQNIYVDNKGILHFPKFFGNLVVRVKHRNVKQVRIITRNSKIVIEVIYEREEIPVKTSLNKVLGIDLGVNNFATIASNVEGIEPFIINGKPLKSMNQWYNKEISRLQAIAKVSNNLNRTNRMCKLTERRNNKVKDSLHKISRYIVDFAVANNIDLIIIGNNSGWKQGVDLGKRNNQVFVSLPFSTLISMIEYKAMLNGIVVQVVEESYTSGTSYLDNETPIKAKYNKQRRLHRGLFRSNKGVEINADVNAAYQIIRKNTSIDLPIKIGEKVTRINVA